MRCKLLNSSLLACLFAGAASIGLHAQDVLSPGFLKVDYFDGIDGAAPIDNLTGDPRYPGSPDSSDYWSVFGPYASGNNHGENFGARVTGFLIPPVTGDYKFYLRSDDAGQLWLSTDDKEANLAGPIADQTGCCNAFTDAEGTLSSTPVTLTAGKKYFVQGLLKEGGGDDYIQIAWRKPGENLNDPVGLQPIPAAYLAVMAPSAGKSVAISQQPANANVAENSSASFTVDFTSTPASPVAIVWFKNGVPIEGASGKTLTIALAKTADNGAKIHAQVSVPGAVATSSDATLAVTADTVPPTVASVKGSATFDRVTIKFSEPVTAATAGTKANYAIDGGLTISDVTMPDPTTVKLTTSKQTEGTGYNITINNIKDTAAGAGNTIAANTKVKLNSYITRSGVLLVDYFDNIPGAAPMDNLTTDSRYPNNPDSSDYWTLFGPYSGGNNHGENFGARVTAILTPTVTGDYKFYLRSDDAGQLWLSSDDSAANVGAAPIAEQTGCCNAFTDSEGTLSSSPITLTAGKKYFIQGLLKEGGGDDYIQIGWRKPGEDLNDPTGLQPIPGTFFSAPVPPEGLFLNTSPKPDIKDANPDLVQVVHVDGKNVFDQSTVSLKIDGNTVAAQVTKAGSIATISYIPNPIFAGGSSHQASLLYTDPDGNPATMTWQFTVGPLTKDSVHSYFGVIKGAAVITADAGGHTGKAGDRAVDLGKSNGSVYVPHADFVNTAAANDEMTFSVWVKKYDIAASSGFWINSPSSNNGQRGWQAHIPWSDNNIYFDTAGCCDGGTQRINGLVTDFDDYKAVGDDTYWTGKWHNIVFTKKGSTKQVWIDGKNFLEGDNTTPLPTDFTDMYFGADGTGGANFMHALIDDYALFATALSSDDINKLVTGTSPSALAASTKLMAYWNFNEAGSVTPPTGPSLSITRDNTGIKITYTGTLQVSDTVTGAWTDVSGASPLTVNTTGSQHFYRAKQ